MLLFHLGHLMDAIMLLFHLGHLMDAIILLFHLGHLMDAIFLPLRTFDGCYSSIKDI